jgi:branched-chain amino acid transport system permease protein
MTTFLIDLIGTLSNAAIVGMLACSITLVYGLTGIVNFAQGDLMTVGGISLYVVCQVAGLPQPVGWIAAIAAVAGLMFLAERSMFRFTLSRPQNGFLISLGLVLIIENVLVQTYGDKPIVTTSYGGGVHIAGAILPWQQILTVIAGVVVMLAVQWFLHYTRRGLQLRAAATDKEMAGHLGVNTRRSVITVFVLSGALAGFAGALLVELTPIFPTVGSDYIVTAFAVALLGGLGSVTGAFVGALIVEAAQTGATALNYASWSDGVAFAIILIVLVVRPKGLFRAASQANAS